jgi:threonine/homoserine/homoserine lactone efflux protein
MRLLRIFSTGLMISFLGTLPLGTLNIAAMQISVSDGVQPAMNFVMGALLVEMLYVRLSLVAMNWVMKNKRLFNWLEWISIVVIIALAASSFIAAADPVVKKNVLLSGRLHNFWLGTIMSALNPVQIPFWFGWSTVLFSRKVLLHKNSHYNTYILGIGVGTFIGNLIFIFGGRFVVEVLNTNQRVLHAIIGSIFLLTASILLWKKLSKSKEEKEKPPHDNSR